MRKINFWLSSFSFRVAFVVFIAVVLALFFQQSVYFFQAIQGGYEDTQMLVDAYDLQIDEVMQTQGIEGVKKFIVAAAQNPKDKHLYFLLKSQDTLLGNLSAWPARLAASKEYQSLKLTDAQGFGFDALLIYSSYEGAEVVIASDLSKIDTIKDRFYENLIENFCLALAIGFILSYAVVFLVAYKLKKINIACDQIMSGDFSYRVPVRGAADQFDVLAGNINAMLDWIKTLLETVQDSTNALAHDLSTPLSRLRLGLEALLLELQDNTDGVNNTTNNANNTIAQRVQEIDNLIDFCSAILEIARVESRLSLGSFEALNVVEVVDNVLDFCQPLLQEKNMGVQKNYPVGLIEVRGDFQLLTKAIINLLDNAIKYSPSGSEIAVAVFEGAQGAVVRIADRGPGLDEALKDRVKERFFRADPSRSSAGHGLGLSLVDAVARLHQGRLVLKNAEPRGLVVSFILRKGC